MNSTPAVDHPTAVIAFTRPRGDFGEPLALTAAMHLGWWRGDDVPPLPVGNGGGIWFASAAPGPSGCMQQRLLSDPAIARDRDEFIAVAVELDDQGRFLPATRILVATSRDLIHFADQASVIMPEGGVHQPSIAVTSSGTELSWNDDRSRGWVADLKIGSGTSVITRVRPGRTSLPGPVDLRASETEALAAWATSMKHQSDGGFTFPFVYAHADPQIFAWNDRWFLLATDDRGGDNIHSRGFLLRASSTVHGLEQAEDIALVGIGPGGMGGCFWAPEAHVIGGRLRILFAPSIGSASWDAVECHVMTLHDGGDPANAGDWSIPRPVRRADGSRLQPGGISLDMTHFVVDERDYVCWSQRTVGDIVGDAELWIATIDPSDPTRLTSDPARICTASYSWEVVDRANVAEGPYVLLRDDQVFMAYAAGGVGPNYATGLLRAQADADLLDPDSWNTSPFPILDSHSVPGQLGPGHLSFFAQDDETFVVFHAKRDRAESERHTGIRPVRWAPDGSPILSG